MSDYSQTIVPLASYNLKVEPGFPTLAIDEEFPVAIRLTMAALDPTDPQGDEPSTLKIIKRPTDFPEDGILYDSEDSEDDEEEEDEESEEEEKPKKKESKKGKKSKKEESDEEMEEENEDEDSEDEDDFTFEIEEYVLCTLSPKTSYQQTIDLVITADEDVMFEVSGSYPIHLSGNYIDHPFDSVDSDFDDEDLMDSDEFDEDYLDGEDYDLSPDEDEVLPAGSKIEELSEDDDEDEESSEEEEKPQPKKKDSKKRAADEEPEAKSKKQKKNVEFKKDLEQGPTGSTAKQAGGAKKVDGITIEDKKTGNGPTVKKGDKVGIRYIGKLNDGKVFDSNTKGKPFYFTVGTGEVVPGMEAAVKGMQVQGERRAILPPNMAYGKQKLPGIPANSTLTFDIKLVNIT